MAKYGNVKLLVDKNVRTGVDKPMNSEEQTMRRLLLEVERMHWKARAIRVRGHYWAWPIGHRDAPKTPDYVREFEDKFGPGPDSANRVLEGIAE